MRTDHPPGLYPGIVMAPSSSDRVSSTTSAMAMSVAVPMPSQCGHMPPLTENDFLSTCLPSPLSIVTAPLPLTVATLKEYAFDRSEVRFGQAGEEGAQLRVDVGHRAHRRARIGSDALLVDEDGRRQSFEDVDLGAGHGRHEALDERRIGLVDHPLGFRGDGVEDERALARARHAGEHGEPAFGDLDGDVLEVVLPRSADADEVVAVGWVHALSLSAGCGSCSRPDRAGRSRADHRAGPSAPARYRRPWPPPRRRLRRRRGWPGRWRRSCLWP
jgi:hypothetical protein